MGIILVRGNNESLILGLFLFSCVQDIGQAGVPPAPPPVRRASRQSLNPFQGHVGQVLNLFELTEVDEQAGGPQEEFKDEPENGTWAACEACLIR